MMPRFHFPIVDGHTLEDPVGTDFLDDEKAVRHAEHIAHHLSNLGHAKPRSVLAVDDAGTEIHKANVKRSD